MLGLWKTICLILCLSCVGDGVRVETKYGPVIGQSHKLHNGKEISSFLGIPFAKPPLGSLRFKPTEEPESWTEPLKANRLRSVCMQRVNTVINLTHKNWTDYSEDCLHLNIYTPKDMSKGPYPVLMFTFGGGYVTGSAMAQPGYLLASYDIIYVAPNYRLDSLGFAPTEDSTAPGNYGLYDLRQALIFIKDNIAAFGGDPNKVTISGQSAGSGATGLLTISPLTQGLFHQVLHQSGSDLSLWALHSKTYKPWTYTQQLAEQLNCSTSSNKVMIECLRSKPAEQVIDFMPLCTPGHPCGGFAPVVDGHFIPEEPFIIRNSPSSFTRVPTMTSQTEKEQATLVNAFYPDGLTNEEFKEALRTDITIGLTGKEYLAEDIVRAFQFYYTPWGQETLKEANRDALVKVSTDLFYSYGHDIILKDVARTTSAYNCVMKYSSKSSLFPKWMGAYHGTDLPYFCGLPFLKRNPSIWKESGFTQDYFPYNEEDEKISDFMMTLWSNFVKTGNPTPTPVQTPDGKSSTTWGAFTEKSRNSFILDMKPHNEEGYRQRAYALFSHYLPYLLSKEKA